MVLQYTEYRYDEKGNRTETLRYDKDRKTVALNNHQ